MKVSAEYKDNRLTLIINDKVVREVEPIHGNAYSFKFNGEECHFIFESKNNKKMLFLYPLNEFKPNKLVV